MGDYYDAALDRALEEQEPVFPEELEKKDETPSIEEESLLTRGYFSSTVEVGTHQIVIRTLRIGEELEVAMVVDKYKETVEGSRALMAATIAAAIVSVDGYPLVRSLGPNEDTIEHKFNWVKDNWYFVTIRELYDEYNLLLTKALNTFDRIKKG